MYVSNLNQLLKKKKKEEARGRLGLTTQCKKTKVPNLPNCVLKIKDECEDSEKK